MAILTFSFDTQSQVSRLNDSTNPTTAPSMVLFYRTQVLPVEFTMSLGSETSVRESTSEFMLSSKLDSLAGNLSNIALVSDYHYGFSETSVTIMSSLNYEPQVSESRIGILSYIDGVIGSRFDFLTMSDIVIVEMPSIYTVNLVSKCNRVGESSYRWSIGSDTELVSIATSNYYIDSLLRTIVPERIVSVSIDLNSATLVLDVTDVLSEDINLYINSGSQYISSCISIPNNNLDGEVGMINWEWADIDSETRLSIYIPISNTDVPLGVSAYDENMDVILGMKGSFLREGVSVSILSATSDVIQYRTKFTNACCFSRPPEIGEKSKDGCSIIPTYKYTEDKPSVPESSISDAINQDVDTIITELYSDAASSEASVSYTGVSIRKFNLVNEANNLSNLEVEFILPSSSFNSA